MTKEKQILTYSLLSSFRNCRKKAKLRYEDALVPLKRDDNLKFGTLIHECLDIWHERRNIDEVHLFIDSCTSEFESQERRFDLLAKAMMTGYSGKYASEDFIVIAQEKEFIGDIVDPATGAKSDKFQLAGKIDMLAQMSGEYYLVEHKTASKLDGDYLSKLWMDMQIITYAHYIEQEMGIQISGVIYNVLLKPQLKQKGGETDQEFEQRKKTMKQPGRAKQKMPETDEEFLQRLNDWYKDHPEAFHREELIIPKQRTTEFMAELYELSLQYDEAKKRSTGFYMNTSQCHSVFGTCPYYAICSSGNNPNVIENQYTIERPHSELTLAGKEN